MEAVAVTIKNIVYNIDAAGSCAKKQEGNNGKPCVLPFEEMLRKYKRRENEQIFYPLFRAQKAYECNSRHCVRANLRLSHARTAWSLEIYPELLEYDSLYIFSERHLQRIDHLPKRNVVSGSFDQYRHQVRMSKACSSDLGNAFIDCHLRTVGAQLGKLPLLLSF